MENKDLITKFYTSFANGEAGGMISCYHENIEFSDPAFGVLHGEEAKNMWSMLIERSKGDLKINFTNVSANNEKGSADWTAQYLFSTTGRNVFNEIHAEFDFQDGRIIRHRDHFDIWKWSKQALGMPGVLLGWSSFMQNKIRENARGSLKQYTDQRAE